MLNPALFSSDKDDWETPQDFFDQLHAEFRFTLDPAADEHNRKCERYYTKAQDGLSQDWNGHTVFVNPPYGRNTTERWVEKAYRESRKRDTTIVMLLPARTDTRWFHDFILGKAEVRFVKGRLKFDGGTSSAPFPSMLVIFRGQKEGREMAAPDYRYMSDKQIVALFGQGYSIKGIAKTVARLDGIKPREARERVEHAIITHSKGELLC